MEMLKEYGPFLIPLIIAQLVLAITALVHVLRHPNYRFGTKGLWIPVVLLVVYRTGALFRSRTR